VSSLTVVMELLVEHREKMQGIEDEWRTIP